MSSSPRFAGNRQSATRGPTDILHGILDSNPFVGSVLGWPTIRSVPLFGDLRHERTRGFTLVSCSL